MKKIISLILVVLLCLPASFIAVSAEGADTYTITAADGAYTSTNDYKNINKYLDYYDGGDELNIPAEYITVDQWKKNIKNPAINAEGLSNDDYITSACTLTWTALDGVTTKTVYINAVDYNYMFKEIDTTKEFSSSSNVAKVSTKGANGTVTSKSIKLSDGSYALATSIDDCNAKAYLQIEQLLADINTISTTPYIVDYDVQFEDADSLSGVDFAFTKGNSQKVAKTISNFSDVMTNAKAGNVITLSVVVYPKANLADIYVDGNLCVENHSLESSDSKYTDYKALFFRFYNKTSVGGEYKKLTFNLTRAEIRYGFGNLDSEIYVEPSVEITNYNDGASITPEEIIAVEASANKAGYKKAELYIDGVKVDEMTMSGLTASLDASSMGYGKHALEVRMYPEIGAYISDIVTVTVYDKVELSDYTITFDEYDAGTVPTDVSNPASYISSATFLNLSLESVDADGNKVIANDGLVIDYDDERGNVLHAKADQNTDTTKTGRRIEITQSNTANNMALNYDIYFESFSGVSYKFLTTRDTGEKGIVQMDAEGLLTMFGTTTSETKSIQLETDKWYNINLDLNLTMGGQVVLTVYDENGLVGSMESIIEDTTYADRIRLYTPYNKDNPTSGEAYIDNVKVTIVSATGNIGEITATTDDLYTVSAVMNGISKVEGVELSDTLGDVDILGYIYNSDNSTLNVTTSYPLNPSENYTIKVYADGYAVPFTSGFVLAGGYIKVTDSYFDHIKGKDYAVLNVANTTENDGKVTVLISEWNGEQIVSMTAKTITVVAGENKYNVEITGNVDNTKVMPVSSLAKPILLSKDIITK